MQMSSSPVWEGGATRFGDLLHQMLQTRFRGGRHLPGLIFVSCDYIWKCNLAGMGGTGLLKLMGWHFERHKEESHGGSVGTKRNLYLNPHYYASLHSSPIMKHLHIYVKAWLLETQVTCIVSSCFWCRFPPSQSGCCWSPSTSRWCRSPPRSVSAPSSPPAGLAWEDLIWK